MCKAQPAIVRGFCERDHRSKIKRVKNSDSQIQRNADSLMDISWYRLLAPLTYMAGLFVLSSVPEGESDTVAGLLLEWVTPQWQNLLHVPVYSGLALTWIWALSPRSLNRHSLLTIALLLTLLWGVLDEMHQATVPGRYASLTDLLLNLTGALLAVAYAWKTGFARARTAPG